MQPSVSPELVAAELAERRRAAAHSLRPTRDHTVRRRTGAVLVRLAGSVERAGRRLEGPAAARPDPTPACC